MARQVDELAAFVVGFNLDAYGVAEESKYRKWPTTL